MLHPLEGLAIGLFDEGEGERLGPVVERALAATTSEEELWAALVAVAKLASYFRSRGQVEVAGALGGVLDRHRRRSDRVREATASRAQVKRETWAQFSAAKAPRAAMIANPRALARARTVSPEER